MILRDRANRPDPYRLAAQALGVEPTAGQDDVKKAYKKSAQKFHPDQHAGEGRDSVYAARFHLATTAKNLLLARGGAGEARAVADFNKAREEYDKELAAAGLKQKAQPQASASASGAASSSRTGGSTQGPGPSAGAGRAHQAGSEGARAWKPSGFGSSGSTGSAGQGAWKPWRPQEFKDEPKRPEGNTWNRSGFRTESPRREEAPRAAAHEPPRAPEAPPRREEAIRPETVRPAPASTYQTATPTPARPTDPRARAATEAYLDRGPEPTGQRINLYV